MLLLPNFRLLDLDKVLIPMKFYFKGLRMKSFFFFFAKNTLGALKTNEIKLRDQKNYSPAPYVKMYLALLDLLSMKKASQ